MLKFAAQRLLAIVPTMLILTFLVFILIDLKEGDAATALAPEDATKEDIERLRDELGLNDPLVFRYGRFVADAVQGDLGDSLRYRLPVTDQIQATFPISLGLGAAAMFGSVVVGVPLGVFTALRRRGVVARVVSASSALLVAFPPFILGIMLIRWFALDRSWLPAIGYVAPSQSLGGWLRHIILPAAALGAIPAAEISRQTRAAFLDTLSEDYVRTARVKGLRRREILIRHVARNVSISIITVIGLNVTRVIGGTVVVERIFGIPGFGSMAVDAVLQSDMPVIQGVVLVSGVIVVMANFAVDLICGYSDPRVRAGRA